MKIIKVLLNLILCFILVISGFKIYTKLNSYQKDKITYEKVSSLEKNSLKDTNSDYMFWLKIPNTNINYPVIQGTDNEYYLTHDFYKNKSQAGSIFMDYRNNENDKNIIIYGHNMKDKTMFADLTKFKDIQFFNDNKYIEITNANITHTYEIFSVYVHKGNADYLIPYFEDDTEFMKYIDTINKNSLHLRSTPITKDDKIITLSTCSYEYEDARTVIHAKLID